MKILKLILLNVFIISFALNLNAQLDSSKIIKFSDRKPAELEIHGLLVPSKYSEIGYAYCYYFKVENVIKGNLDDDYIILTVAAGDDSQKSIFDSGTDTSFYLLRFVFNKSNEEYSKAYLTGFVDSKRNSWRLVSAYKRND